MFVSPRAGAQQGAPLGTAQLQVSGARLSIYRDSLTTDAEQTVNVGEPARIRTCYGTGACGSAAAGSVPGLKVVGELTGPELPQAISYETVPGGTFFLPGFQREGDYLLENVRLVDTATGHVLANAEPSLATLHVRQILLASATVTRLTLADLQARGITLTQQNFNALGRPAEERIGARDPLTRGYDAWSREVAVGLPTGVGRHGVGSFTGYQRSFDSLDRLVGLAANTGGPKLGARWDWGGTARLYGITTDNALKTAHRMSYLGSGLGAQPGGTITTPWQLGTISVASSDPKQPVTDEPTALWGQFGYGYRTGDGVKRGREVMDHQSGKPGLFAHQGWP